MNDIGKYIIFIGIIITLIGVVIYLTGTRFGWFGNLPGVIRIERDNIRIYIPIVSMLIVSIIITVLVWVARRIMG